MKVDILIVGAGMAGIAAAKESSARGASVLLADHSDRLGGVLPQCTHRGFAGTLTGPEYLSKQLADFPEGIDLRLNTTVLSVTSSREAVLSSPQDGVYTVKFRQLILATGCREIPAGALPLGGTRPREVYTAGQAQALLNLEGIAIPGPVVILGSGDLGLIMAQQLTAAGVTVAAIVEKKPRCGGLVRNRRRVEPLHIPLYTEACLERIEGYPHLSGVQIRPREGEPFFLPCQSLVIAAGLAPERTLIQNLGEPHWLHLCGNCAKIHPMVELVAAEGKMAAEDACNNIER